MKQKRVETMKNKSEKHRTVLSLAIVTGLGMFSLFLGCQTLEQRAPPVGEEFQKVADRHRVDVATLELGREIYLSECARCHSVEPIDRYSADRWRGILPRMSLETNLDERETDAVETYVTLARVLLNENAKTKREAAANRDRTRGENAVDTNAVRGSR